MGVLAAGVAVKAIAVAAAYSLQTTVQGRTIFSPVVLILALMYAVVFTAAVVAAPIIYEKRRRRAEG